MANYENDSKELLKQVGGKENIAAVSHCMTRMRFVLNDPGKADVEAIEKIKSVKGSFTQAGQFQVIIGNTVPDFYNDFIKVAGIEGVSKDAAKEAAKANQSWLQRLMTSLAEIFTPLIPAIITGGLILGFRNIIDSVYLFEAGTKTLVEISQFWAGIDSFLWLIGEAVFHMLPVGICWSITRKMGTTQILGIILGLTLVSGQLLNAYAVATTPAAEIPYWDFEYFKINMIGYQAQIIPAILAAFTLVYLERFFRKITPQVVSMIVVPFCSLVLSVVAAHFILGPIGWTIGSWVSAIVYAGISGSFRIIFGALFGFFYAPLVITGLHHMSNAIDLQLIADFGGTTLWPMIALSNIAQGSAVLAMIVLQKKDADAEEVNVPSCISCYLGVTEPAIFGVNLKYVFPFVCGMIGSACAGVLSIAFNVTANSIGVGGLPGILSIQPQYMIPFALAMLVAIAVPFALTFIVGKKKGIGTLAAEAAMPEAANPVKAFESDKIEVPTYDMIPEKDKKLHAYLSGKTVKLADVPDQVFASGAMGPGMAIEPSDNILVSPGNGQVVVTMDGSNHAIGLKMDNGTEVLLHIGIDTVNMQGDGFVPKVKKGQRVKTGQPLIEFDLDKIAKAGHPAVTMMILTDTNGQNPEFKEGIKVKAGKDVIAEVKE